MRKLFVVSAAILGLAALPVAASAGTLTGTLGIGGGIIYDTQDTTGGAVLDFSPTGGGDGQVITLFSQTGDLADIDSFTTATILDLTNVLAAPGAFCDGTPCDVPNFLSDFSDPDGAGLHFDLTGFVVQSGTPCTGTEGLGDSCTTGLFSLEQTVNGLRIQFDVLGNFVQGADSGAFIGAFSSTFTGVTFAEAFAALAAGTDITCADGIPCTFDANFRSVPSEIPEPASMLLLGSGLMGVVAARRRRNKK